MPGVEQHRDLLVPGAAAQRISVDQDDRLSRPVVLVVELDMSGVLLSDLDVGHCLLLPIGRRRSRRRHDAPTGLATHALASPATGFNRSATAPRGLRDQRAAKSTWNRNCDPEAARDRRGYGQGAHWPQLINRLDSPR